MENGKWKMGKVVDNEIAVDIGNSRIKLFDSEKIVSFDINKSWLPSIKNTLKKRKGRILKAGICSVNSIIEIKLIEILDSLEIKFIRSKNLLKKQNLIDFRNIKGMGDDRKLGLIGALNYYKLPFITVDIGTAITINILDKNKVCKGGVIFPGPYTQVKSLAQNTEGLKEIKLSISHQIAGFDTKTAISNGIVYGICGAIKEIIGMLKIQNPEFKKAGVILTGGGAGILNQTLKELKFKFKYEEDLVLRGILKIMG